MVARVAKFARDALRVNLPRVDRMGCQHEVLLMAAGTTLIFRRRHKNSDKDRMKREEQCAFQCDTKLLVGLWIDADGVSMIQLTWFLAKVLKSLHEQRMDGSSESFANGPLAMLVLMCSRS